MFVKAPWSAATFRAAVFGMVNPGLKPWAKFCCSFGAKTPTLPTAMFMKHTLSCGMVFGKSFIMPMLMPASVSARFRCKLL